MHVSVVFLDQNILDGVDQPRHVRRSADLFVVYQESHREHRLVMHSDSSCVARPGPCAALPDAEQPILVDKREVPTCRDSLMRLRRSSSVHRPPRIT